MNYKKDFYPHYDNLTDPLNALAGLYRKMDRAYAEVAEQNRFHCDGCSDNCCRSLFFHHTLVEFLYLRRGFQALASDVQAEVLARAALVADRQLLPGADDHDGDTRMCPLNVDSRCILYAHRPMICRLHGLPYQMTIPGCAPTSGSGCHQFHQTLEKPPDFVLERTPLYQALADLERRTRKLQTFDGKIKMTVAQIILNETPKNLAIETNYRLRS